MSTDLNDSLMRAIKERNQRNDEQEFQQFCKYLLSRCYSEIRLKMARRPKTEVGDQLRGMRSKEPVFKSESVRHLCGKRSRQKVRDCETILPAQLLFGYRDLVANASLK